MCDDTTILFFPTRPVLCLHCGMANDPQNRTCSRCGQNLPSSIPPVTRVIERTPFLVSVGNPGNNLFDQNSGVLLQFLPSGSCMHSTVLAPLTLGRGDASTNGHGELFDLSSLNAVRHGVSRSHCKIMRRGNHLVAMDLGSRNGTHLNGKPLRPYEEHVLAHGDELVLGTLHVILFFQQAWAAST